jgi:hypothetical protein
MFPGAPVQRRASVTPEPTPARQRSWQTPLGNVLSAALSCLAFYLFFMNFFRDDPPNRRVLYVNRATGLEAAVEIVSDSKGYKIYLENSRAAYNFDAFVNQRLAPDQGLGYYLRGGDHISKPVNSLKLTLKRGGVVSVWTLEPELTPVP